MKTYDLHGFTLEEALKLMDKVVGECRLEGGEHILCIITGRGIIRTKITKYFETNKIDYRFELGNDGAYIITVE
ncbi:MAG: Smr/MutS family protein [Bdellovibrionales bacterium]|jgi:DNA-nicking Smr family endonuclease|nr:Smr/MutS family protein [Bdellovibrionales bacterium]